MADILQMSGDADFAYTQARVQARHGTRLTDHEWHRLDATHDLAQYLHALRATARARWVVRIAPDMGTHALEARLRAEWRAYAQEVARLQPEQWRAPVAWTAHVVDLPVVDHLLHGGRVHAWMAEDELYAPWTRTDLHERERALAESPLAELLIEARAGLSAARAWLAIWRRLWPQPSSAHRRALEAIARAVEEHIASLRSPAAASSLELRRTLAQRLQMLFRRDLETAGASIAHLLLEAVDLERVRAGLVRRALLKPPGAQMA